MAFETRYDVNIHVLSSVPVERLPAMCGSATLAMLVSSTSINVASVTVRAMIHGLTAGRHAAASFMVMAAAPIYLIQTLGKTDIPGGNFLFFILPLSNTILTGMRCTTFT